MKNLIYLIKKAWYFAWHRHHLLIPLPVLKNYIRSFFRILKRGGIGKNIFTSSDSYNEWRKSHEIKMVKCKYNELITVMYPIIEFNLDKIKDTINSIQNQSYKKIQLVIVTDERYYSKISKIVGSSIEVINTKTKKDICYMYNEGIKQAKGNYICFINSNIILEKDTLSYVGKYIFNNKKVDILYADEDHLDDKKVLYGPLFKPDWSLDSFLGENYFGNLLVIKKEIVNQVGLLTPKYNQLSFKEFYLKCISKSNNIKHIPFILFHDYEHQKESKYDKELLEDYLKYNKIKADVLKTDDYDGYVIKYHHNNPLVSIIIPFKNQFKYTKNCIDSLTEKLSYKNYEIILVDNGTTDEEMLNWLKELSNNQRIKIFSNPIEFNFSKLCNYGARHSKGDYYLFLNNDIELIDGNFLDWMVGYASQKDVGAVGLKLLYKDRLVQHMGVIISYGGYAGHYGVAHKETEQGYYSMCVRPYNFSAVTAACLLVSKEKFNQIKGFDENLAVALNDVDLCLKLLDCSYRNVCLNNIKMFHFESKSRGYDSNKAKSERYKKEQEYLKNKWKDNLNSDRYYNENYF